MTDYYRSRFYGSTYLPQYHRETLEYPGYNNGLVLGQQSYDGIYLSPTSASYQHHPHHYQHSHNAYGAHLAWATEIPVRLRLTICCEGCKVKLERNLRDLPGVHDVAIAGWSNAMVTVTGTAPARKILKQARKISKSAEYWDDSYVIDEYTGRRVYHQHH